MNTKQEMRKYYLEKRRQLSHNNVRMLSKLISDKVLILNEIKKAETIALYLPINNEVDTREIINRLLEGIKQIVVPCYFEQEKNYHFVKFYNWQSLETGPSGILQPVTKTVIDSQKIAAVIMPGLAFDINGVRLGYGKGVYDKLLKDFQASKIGLAYNFQIVDRLPKESHDLMVDLIISEKRSISCLTTSQ